ncbi:SDR family NAD(P)-dependent oxidoreductase [Oscillatoria sp. FACHB-1407]|uniref:SDR family NAD(P)-dependent oxidoreductase n=1 Tax=Oscillatoria sp. FACHB-1407 TaxID=2692847 RepID=UPI001683A57C|nr:SDR family NAD(P)-dependent oxidoreductase [Oscillatoria sp. FACHB-1407]MBD2463532.1 SDR family NAD(P)-dependent oxidoreductase [Oscillatoria sp. FACHB-1407]
MLEIANELNGKVALVTGGSRGIGRAIAIALANTGVHVAVNFHKQKEAADQVCHLLRETGQKAIAVQADASQFNDTEQMIQHVEQTLGSISILVNNAGIAQPCSLESVTEREWDETIAVNLKSTFLVTQAVLPKMRQQQWGRIIMISSIAAQIGGAVGLHYAASKAGQLGLMHYYARCLINEGITVNAIAAAAIDTDMIASLSGSITAPMGRFGTAEEVAQVAVMLAANGYMTGQTISVNGGLYLT